jgi:Tfp pilus assembly protein PilX
MKPFLKILGNEDGSLIVIVLMILVMVTILGLTATTVSRTEVQISTNALLYQRMFFTAESGIEHIRKELSYPLHAITSGASSDINLTFALKGRDQTAGTSDDATGNDYDSGAKWIDNYDFDGDGMHYSVRIWNNPDDYGTDTTQGTSDDVNTDTDKYVLAQSTATGPWGGKTSIEVRLLGRIKPGTEKSITGYSGQEGAGSGKSYVSSDANAMSSSALSTTQGSGLLQ